MDLSSRIDERLLVQALVRHLRAHPALEAVSPCSGDGNAHQVAVECWTVSMARRRLLLQIQPIASELRDRANHGRVAAKLTRRFLDVQTTRHAIATAHALRAARGQALDASLLAIDRSVRAVLLDRDVRPESLVERERSRLIQDTLEDMPPATHMIHGAGDIRYKITDGELAPTLTCEVEVGTTPAAALFGNVFHVRSPLPETILTAAAGRRLGELVSTGFTALDDRTVVDATARVGGVAFTLNEDLVTIGGAELVRLSG